jgi:hypothetical protein
METAEKFRCSPYHDKRAILDLLNKLNPEQMCKVVELSNNLIAEKLEKRKSEKAEYELSTDIKSINDSVNCQNEAERLKKLKIINSGLPIRVLSFLRRDLKINVYKKDVKFLENKITLKKLRDAKGIGDISIFCLKKLFKNAGMKMNKN